MSLRSLLYLLLVPALGACSHLQSALAGGDRNACATVPAGQLGMQMELVRQQMDAGKYHAALAHLDATPSDLPALRLLRAQAQSRIDDNAAAGATFRSLLGTCLSAYAHQGLGKIAAAERDSAGALDHLQRARIEAPVDADIRNDYGFMLLALGRIEPALREFRTAIELDPNQRTAARNLVLALLVAQRSEEAQSFAARHGVDAGELETLSRRALGYRPLHAPLPDGDPSHETS